LLVASAAAGNHPQLEDASRPERKNDQSAQDHREQQGHC
jgi:hypothetical protein